MELVLFHYWRSSASWRVRWGLELKKVPHRKVAVNLLAAEEKQSTYLEKNPAGYLPCLVADGKPLGESLAILEWLDETFPGAKLLPGDPLERARIRQLAETVNSGVQPLQNLDVIRHVSPEKERQAEWVRHWIQRGLRVYEELLGNIGGNGKFSLTDEPTLADLCLVPQCYSAKRFGVELAAFPRCHAIYEHALTTPACQASSPEAHQPPGGG